MASSIVIKALGLVALSNIILCMETLGVISYNYSDSGAIITEMGAPALDVSRDCVYFADYFNLYKISRVSHTVIQKLPLEIGEGIGFTPSISLLSPDNSFLLLASGTYDRDPQGLIIKIDLQSFTIVGNRTYYDDNVYQCAIVDAASNTATFFGEEFMLSIDIDTMAVVNNVSVATLPLYTAVSKPNFAEWDPTNTYVLLGMTNGALLRVDPASLKASLILDTESFIDFSFPAYAYLDSGVIYLVVYSLEEISLVALDVNKNKVIQPAIALYSSLGPVVLLDRVHNYLFFLQDFLYGNSTLQKYSLDCFTNTTTLPCVKIVEQYDLPSAGVGEQGDSLLDQINNIGYIPLKSQQGVGWVQTNLAVISLD